MKAHCKEQQFENLADFVRWAVRQNAGNYPVIRQQMTMVDKFANSEKNLTKFKEVYNKFFVDNVDDEKVDNLQFIADDFTVKYERNTRDCKVAVEASINEDRNKSGIVMNITKKVTSGDGHKEENSTMLHFSDRRHLTYEYQSNFDMADVSNDTIRSNNNYIREHVNYEFGFDETNYHFNHISHNCQMSESGNWDRIEDLQILTNKDLEKLEKAQAESDMTK